jgi:hypothetical protein
MSYRYKPRWQLVGDRHWTRADAKARAAYLRGIEAAKLQRPEVPPRWGSAYVRAAFMHGYRDEVYRIGWTACDKDFHTQSVVAS